MADPRQLDILQQGIAEWNKWRSLNAGKKVDLVGAILVGFDLREANLSGADLSGAHLAGAYLDRAQLEKTVLRNAKLFRAHLGDANLKGADLENADLGGAHLSGANLGGTNLRGAQLRGTNFYGAALGNADLRGAKIGRTIFANVNLSRVKGLDQVVHVEPSTIGLDAYFQSKDKIPQAFLVGSGLPQTAIDYLAGFLQEQTRSKKAGHKRGSSRVR